MKTLGYIALFAGVMMLLTQSARSAPPCAECAALAKKQTVLVQAKVDAPAKSAAPAAVTPAPAASAKAAPAKAVAQPKSAVTRAARVREFFTIRAGDGPVRRLARAFLGGCN